MHMPAYAWPIGKVVTGTTPSGARVTGTVRSLGTVPGREDCTQVMQPGGARIWVVTKTIEAAS